MCAQIAFPRSKLGHAEWKGYLPFMQRCLNIRLCIGSVSTLSKCHEQ